MPLGTAIHNIEITLGKGGQLARAADEIVPESFKEPFFLFCFVRVNY